MRAMPVTFASEFVGLCEIIAQAQTCTQLLAVWTCRQLEGIGIHIILF